MSDTDSVSLFCPPRAWVPINNCYLMSKEIPFSVKKTKSIFNSAMQEMEVYVENIRRKFGVFNYSPFRTPYTPNSQYQMLLDPSNPSAGTAKTDKQEKVKLNFDMTASPKILLSKPLLSGGAGRRISLSDMPRSPTSTNSSVHTGSDVEQDPEKKAPSSHFSASEESMDFLDKSTGQPQLGEWVRRLLGALWFLGCHTPGYKPAGHHSHCGAL